MLELFKERVLMFKKKNKQQKFNNADKQRVEMILKLIQERRELEKINKS